MKFGLDDLERDWKYTRFLPFAWLLLGMAEVIGSFFTRHWSYLFSGICAMVVGAGHMIIHKRAKRQLEILKALDKKRRELESGAKSVWGLGDGRSVSSKRY